MRNFPMCVLSGVCLHRACSRVRSELVGDAIRAVQRKAFSCRSQQIGCQEHGVSAVKLAHKDFGASKKQEQVNMR